MIKDKNVNDNCPFPMIRLSGLGLLFIIYINNVHEICSIEHTFPASELTFVPFVKHCILKLLVAPLLLLFKSRQALVILRGPAISFSK